MLPWRRLTDHWCPCLPYAFSLNETAYFVTKKLEWPYVKQTLAAFVASDGQLPGMCSMLTLACYHQTIIKHTLL